MWGVSQTGHNVDHARQFVGNLFLDSWANHANLVTSTLSEVTASVFMRDEHHVHRQSGQLLVDVKEIVTHKIPCLEAVITFVGDAQLAVSPEAAVFVGVLHQVDDHSFVAVTTTRQVGDCIGEDRPCILNLDLALILRAD